MSRAIMDISTAISTLRAGMSIPDDNVRIAVTGPAPIGRGHSGHRFLHTMNSTGPLFFGWRSHQADDGRWVYNLHGSRSNIVDFLEAVVAAQPTVAAPVTPRQAELL